MDVKYSIMWQWDGCGSRPNSLQQTWECREKSSSKGPLERVFQTIVGGGAAQSRDRIYNRTVQQHILFTHNVWWFVGFKSSCISQMANGATGCRCLWLWRVESLLILDHPYSSKHADFILSRQVELNTAIPDAWVCPITCNSGWWRWLKIIKGLVQK